MPLAWEQALRQALRPGEILQLVARSGPGAAVACTPARVFLIREEGLSGPTVWSAAWDQVQSVHLTETAAGGVLELALRDMAVAPAGGLQATFTILDRVKFEGVRQWIERQIQAGQSETAAPAAAGRCRCGAEIRPHTAYCPTCGTALGGFCPGCLHVVQAEDRFCGTCGLSADLSLPVLCPGCSGRLAPGGLWCPICGRRVMDVCPECGNRSVSGWTYCPYCAHRAGSPTEPGLLPADAVPAPAPWGAAAPPAAASQAELLNQQGAEAYGKDDYAKAADLFRQASELDTAEPLYLTNLSAALDELGEDDEAEAALKRAMALDGDNLNTLMSYGTYCAERERPGEAAKMWRRVMHLGPGTEEATEATRNIEHLGQL